MTHAKSNKAVIIGGGISGLAAAALLAKQGWQVTLLEKNAKLGGRARVMKEQGFTFDMGPSWYFMPEVFEKFFGEFNRKTSDFYTLIKLDPRYKIFFENKDALTFHDDLAQNVRVFEQIEAGSGKKLQQFLSKTKNIYHLALSNLLYKNLWDVSGYTNLRTVSAAIRAFVQFPLWRSWQQILDTHFKRTVLKQVLGFTALFLGGSPAATPSVFSILAWADFGTGVWYPKGGMKKIIDALVQLCKENGVTIHTNAEVSAIQVEDSQVRGVKTANQSFPADIVIGATDLQWLETQLLEKQYQTYPEDYWQQKTIGISALMIYLGTNKRYPDLTHHNLYFSTDWEKNFAEILDAKTLPSDPSLYVSVRSVTDRSLVPENCEEIVILVPLGARTSYRPKDLEKLSKEVIAKVETLFSVSLTPHIVVKKVFTPTDFQQDYNAFKGTALGLAHTARQSLWWRPKHTSSKVKGLYYAGQYTNPGVGVPTSLISAQIIAGMIGFSSDQTASIFKKGSTTYYYSSLFFKGQVKNDVFALYAYVRTIDDFVDTLTPDITQFEQYWAETVQVWNGGMTDNPIVQQFVSLAKRHHFEWGWIVSFWDAMRSDLKMTTYDDYSELEKYMYGSAEVIGLMMAKILALPDAAHKTAALQGKAMQLLNFIRDVDEDRALHRKYLSYDDESIHDERKWKKSIQPYLNKYYRLQKEAENGYVYIPKKYLIPIQTAAHMYRKTAKIIEKDPMIVWRKKVKPSKWSVVFELLLNVIR